MLSCEHLSSLFFYNGFTSLTLGWLSTHILIEKCTLKKNRVHFPFFRVHFPESVVVSFFWTRRGHFLYSRCIMEDTKAHMLYRLVLKRDRRLP